MTARQPDRPRPPEADDVAEPVAPPRSGPDPLDELGERVRAAQEAAERIVTEARESAARTGGDRPPPRGYASAGPREGRSADGRSAEAQAVAALIDLGRGLVPAELRHAVTELVRELLLLLRTLIDWYLERLELRRKTPVEVEDIPID